MKTNAKPRCSVVIRAYNEEKHIGKLLTGIMKQTVRDLQIILVDSGSTDATIAIASRYPVQVVNIQPETFTFGRSLNLGIDQTAADLIVLASAHVYPVYPDWLEQLLQPFIDPQIALVYGKQRGNSTTKFSEHQHFVKMFPRESVHRQSHPLCNNANAAIRRSLWYKRPYDESLTGLEDLEWASWAISQEYYLAYVADAEVIHVHNESTRQVYNRYRREAMALQTIQPEEHFNLLDFFRLVLSNVFSDCWHALRGRVFFREFRNIITFRFMQFWGTYRGFALSGPLTGQLKQSFYYPRGLRSTPIAPGRDLRPIDYPSGDVDEMQSGEVASDSNGVE